MAKADTPTYDPESLYEVRLARPITVGRSVLLPMQTVRLKGKVVAANQADVIEATKVAE
jgi:hypothetical protein